MPSGKKSRTRVLLAAGGGVLVVAVGVVLAVVLLTGGKKAPTVGAIVQGLPGAADVDGLFATIPQHGTTLGSAGAPVTLVEYVDLQCLTCQVIATAVLPQIVRNYVRTGKVRLELRPWAYVGADSVRGQAAVLAAARQQKAFNLAELLYYNQGTPNTGWLTKNMVRSAGEGIPGLRVPQLLDDLESPDVMAAAQHVNALAKTDHVKQTVTVFVGKTGTPGTKVKIGGPGQELKTVVKAIRDALGV